MTEPVGAPPVENLSDVAWARVERGVFARLDGSGTVTGAIATRETQPAPRRTWLWVAVPVAAAAACLLVLFATRPHGTAANSVADTEPARIVSGAAPSAVQFGDAHITLDSDSVVEMVRDGAQPTALLEQGAAWFSVAPRGDRPAFEVRAGDTIVKVVGTRFRVARQGERADVTVDHGTVEVRYRGRALRVTDGQSWSSTKPAEVVPTAAAEPEPEIEIDPAPAATHRSTKH
ncbi:MAG: FecR domain-containing protein [Acidobacteriota bacterium]